MTEPTTWHEQLQFSGCLPIDIEPSQAQLTSDAGLLPLRQFDEALGLTRQFAEALIDPRDPDDVDHTFLEMTRMRVFGILAGYEDQNDHDTLRSDPVFKVIADRSPEGPDLASQPTLSRFENAISPRSLLQLQDVFIDQFLQSFDTPPTHLVFDLDTFDDAVHGQQQLTFFHGHYDQYQYLARVITCANNDAVVMLALLFGTAPPTLGVVDDLRSLVTRLRAVWPDVRISIRADSGFAVPEFYLGCETLRLEYTIGLGMNAVLKRRSETLLEKALKDFTETGGPQRQFDAFEYRAGTWPEPRWVVVKAEANAQGTNRRAVVTNRSGARVLPEATYDDYGERGESENRNKELKCSLCADRLSDHRFMANYFRLYLHCLAANLLVRQRQLVADPPAPYPPSPLPTEALAGKARKQFFNQRRQADPLGEGHAQTWRMRPIKVAAEVIVRARRIIVRLSASWPYLEEFRAVCQANARLFARSPLESG